MGKQTINVDGKSITLVYNRPKRETFRQLDMERATVIAGTNNDNDSVGMKLNDVVVDLLCNKLLRRIEGDFPTPEESLDMEDFMKDNSLTELKSDDKKAFLKEYYYMELVMIAGRMFLPSEIATFIDQSGVEKQATKN
jgi:hypothetical protein